MAEAVAGVPAEGPEAGEAVPVWVPVEAGAVASPPQVEAVGAVVAQVAVVAGEAVQEQAGEAVAGEPAWFPPSPCPLVAVRTNPPRF